MTGLLAFAAGVTAIGAAAQLAPGLSASVLGGASRAVTAVSSALDALLRLGREGREPGALERRRLLASGAVAAFGLGLFTFGALGGAALALATPTLVGRALRARRLAYRRALAKDAPALALAIADALSGGHSLRGALTEAARGLSGAGGAELRRVAAQLDAGDSTDASLERLREQGRSHPIDAIVAASLLHRRSGGDLAGLLRSLARGFEDEQRLEDEVRAATAQARFTGMLVVVLPLGGALLAELASPGFLGGMARSPLTAWLVGVALVLQIAAAILIRRLGRPRA